MKRGPSLLDQLWQELLDQTGKAFACQRAGDEAGWDVISQKNMAGQSGHCLGLAKAIAIMLNPYDPSVEYVRKEVMRRYLDAEAQRGDGTRPDAAERANG